MALFARRPKTPSSAPDGAFPFWEALTADEFRATAAAAFLDAGIEVTVFPDHLLGANGTQYGLANLAASCHNSERRRRDWQTVITRHARDMAAAIGQPSAFDRMSRDQLMASTYCRLLSAEDLPPLLSYARPVAPGLVAVLNLDLPRSVSYFTDDRVQHFGHQALAEAGMANLRRVKPDEHQTLDRDGGVIEVLLGDSIFTASLALVLDEIVGRYGFGIDPDAGAFFAVPNRNQLDFHVLYDQTAIASLQLLAGFAVAGYRDFPGSLSPRVYWWRPGRIEAISRLDDDGIVIEAGPDLVEVLNRLTS